MQSEYLDKKVKEAAEKHHPAYDEQAWRKMEKLLNQHLPVKKDDDRRRIFFLLFFFLLIGGGAFVMISKPWGKNSDVAETTSSEKVLNENKPVPGDKAGNEAQPLTSNPVRQEKPASNDLASDINAQPQKNVPQRDNKEGFVLPPNKARNENQAGRNFQPRNELDQSGVSVTNIDTKPPSRETNTKSPAQNEIAGKNDEHNKQEFNNADDLKTAESNLKQKTPNAQAANTPSDQSQTVKPPIHKEKSSRRSGFALLVSAGPDVSKAGQSNLGKLTLTYGAGMSYTKNRFTLRTGIYGSRKIYNAGPRDYTLGYQPVNTKFEGADANCYVMEIPVQLFYNFAFKNKSNWFAGAGLSSYLMKTEKYEYLFKTSTGYPYYWTKKYKNENKHYFSVLDLSGGYNVHISNTISVSAEPYIKIPLTGIGEGKVNLKSGGILFTVGIKPFK